MGLKLPLTILGVATASWYLTSLVLENNEATFKLSSKLRDELVPLTVDEEIDFEHLKHAAIEKAILYEELINENHLYHGMIVNRGLDGSIHSECDSLLFSALRFVALDRLGWKDDAAEAWQAMLSVNEDGRWYRHPKCRRRWTSRDMIVGVLAALVQNPPEYKKYTEELIAYIGKNDGYIGTGPFYVSMMSPGLGEIIRLLSVQADIDEVELPTDIRYGFSTIEFDAIAGRRGFTAHLNALTLWIERELIFGNSHKPRSIAGFLDNLMGHLADHSFEKQRQQWVAGKLVELDQKNMFFRWLQLLAADAISPRIRYEFLNELMSMPQFPLDRLPQNCDRKADYLWQRDSREYQPIPLKAKCSEEYPGVDFLWMLSMILS